jgi:hypothetical protein
LTSSVRPSQNFTTRHFEDYGTDDPHQGEDLFGMAAEGTSMSNDAGKISIIPSKPRPGENDRGGATNLTDIPRISRYRRRSTVEAQTGTECVSVAFGGAPRNKRSQR